jgi:hypothetical protein
MTYLFFHILGGAQRMHNDAQLEALTKTVPFGRGPVLSYRYNSGAGVEWERKRTIWTKP